MLKCEKVRRRFDFSAYVQTKMSTSQCVHVNRNLALKTDFDGVLTLIQISTHMIVVTRKD